MISSRRAFSSSTFGISSLELDLPIKDTALLRAVLDSQFAASANKKPKGCRAFSRDSLLNPEALRLFFHPGDGSPEAIEEPSRGEDPSVSPTQLKEIGLPDPFLRLNGGARGDGSGVFQGHRHMKGLSSQPFHLDRADRGSRHLVSVIQGEHRVAMAKLLQQKKGRHAPGRLSKASQK